MLPRADITGTRPLGTIDGPSPTTSIADARQESFNRLTQIAIGKQFQAEILSRLNDGTFLVRVADTVARMTLPVTTRAGETFTMTLVSKEPRPTFLLGQQANGIAAPANTTEPLLGHLLPAAVEENPLYTNGGKTVAPQENLNPAGVGTATLPEDAVPAPAIGKASQLQPSTAPTAIANQIAEPPPGSAPTLLSSTGRLINTIIQSAQQSETPNALTVKTPLVSSPNASPPQVAAALKDSLVYSGLFYESHVAQWAQGERPKAELMLEPQSAAGNSQQTGATQTQDKVEEARPLPTQIRETPAQNGTALQNGNATLPASISTETAQLINLQLGALENNRVMWQGELWPGQQLEWEVSEDAPQGESEDPTPTWNSAVRFELPTLGSISATIRMVGDHVHLQVRTTNEAAAAALRLHGAELANALDAAGSPLDSFTIKQDEKN